MKQMPFRTLLALTASAAVAAPPSGGGAVRSTAKGADAFAQCFAQVQNRASQPWSFVPRESGGGTFSNVGAKGVRTTYFLTVADRGDRREIRIVAAGDTAISRAVDHCI